MYKILVVEDDTGLLEAISDYMTAKEMTVYQAEDGEKALELIQSNVFDLLLLDVMIPGIDGFQICKQVRKNSAVPIVFITARCREEDQLYGFELGADDYILKPFSLPVLFAKCKALIARNKGVNKESRMICGSLTIDLNLRKLYIEEKEIVVPPKEYELLLYLVENKNQILSREQLLNKVWGYDYYGDSRVVDTHIKKLRKALGPVAKQIVTVIKAGYKFEEKGNG